jgi:hypothetical protein
LRHFPFFHLPHFISSFFILYSFSEREANRRARQVWGRNWLHFWNIGGVVVKEQKEMKKPILKMFLFRRIFVGQGNYYF